MDHVNVNRVSLSALGAVLFVIPSTIICACQAYAYRAITAQKASG